jgi:hypothetical protein
LKGYRLWVMGQLDSTCRAPPRAVVPIAGVGDGEVELHCEDLERGVRVNAPHGVAVQVEFGKQTLKPENHFIGAS